ncbi:MAG: hypothetical protein WBH55_05005, partial [Bacteroidota bacterium]
MTAARKYRAGTLLALALLAGFTPSLSQEDFFHPELDWHTIETEHFLVHYHDGSERSGRVTSKIAEEIYEPITSLYDHTPDEKVSFIISDYDDISNGAAYFYDNKVVIYASSMDFELRGTHNWLRNVITHEFTHIIQVQASMKFGRTIPAFYFQWLNYEAARRPDVLYGFPNVVVSYPVSGFVVPAWFAEGVAQYNRAELRYDFWDSHRDMILRSYVLDSSMLSWEEMAVFGKTSLGNESSYNAGFAFVSYIAQKYGEDALRDVTRSLSSLSVWTIGAAIEEAVGKDGSEVYDEWVEELTREYAARTLPVRENLHVGEPLQVDSRAEIINPQVIQEIESMMHPAESVGPNGPFSGPCCRMSATVGFANLYPVFSPDGKKVAYTSAKGGDYFGLSALYVYEFEKKKETFIAPAVRTSPAWSPDGTTLYYGKLTRENPHWSLYFDLYEYEIEEEREKRLTTGKRAMNPSLSPDGSQLVCVVNRDGTTNLATMPIEGGELTLITSYSEGEQVYHPHWSPAGDRIVFDYSIKDGRDIASIRPDGSDLTYLVSGSDDSRCATVTPDGSQVLFSSDRTGIFNIYSMELASGEIKQLTNVLGGALYPTMNSRGDLLYSLYTSRGYKIYSITGTEPLPDLDIHYIPFARTAPMRESDVLAMASGGDIRNQFDWNALNSYDDTLLPEDESRSYSNIFGSVSIVPFLRIDNYNPTSKGIELLKPGVYLFSNEILEKTGFFAGAAVNTRLERDLFLQFYYRGQIPLLYQLGLEPVASVELYNVTRKTQGDAAIGESLLQLESTLDLLEFNFALNQRALSQFSETELRYRHSRYTSILNSFTLPESGFLVPSSSDLYFIGNDITLQLKIHALLPSRTREISPVGRRITLRFGAEFNKLQSSDSLGRLEYEISSSGALKPLYDKYTFPRIEVWWREYIPFLFRGHTLNPSLRLGTIVGPPVDNFFDFYAGGLIGMKGYPFYSLGGNEMAILGLSYRFPILEKIDFRFLQMYFDKLYASVYADIGDAWTGRMPTFGDLKRDAGVELRLETFSYYAYPTRIFFNASYGFDKFIVAYNIYDNRTVSYGEEWR